MWILQLPLYRDDYPFQISQGTTSPSGSHPTTVTPPSGSGEPPPVELPPTDTARPAAHRAPSTAQPQAVETSRARLLYCTLLVQDQTFAMQLFNNTAKQNPGEAAAALEAMALGDAETQRVMAVLFKNLFEVDKNAATDVHSLFLRPQPLSLETPTTPQQPQAATRASYISAVEQVVDLGGCSSHSCQSMSSN